jgi:hypothetical protein
LRQHGPSFVQQSEPERVVTAGRARERRFEHGVPRDEGYWVQGRLRQRVLEGYPVGMDLSRASPSFATEPSPVNEPAVVNHLPEGNSGRQLV